jgi:hypothetical protein
LQIQKILREKEDTVAANGFIRSLVAFEYQRENLFYLGLGKILSFKMKNNKRWTHFNDLLFPIQLIRWNPQLKKHERNDCVGGKVLQEEIAVY